MTTKEQHLIYRLKHDPGLAAIGQCVCLTCWNQTGAELLIDLWREHGFDTMDEDDQGMTNCRWQCHGSPSYVVTDYPFRTLKSEFQHADDCIWILIKQYVEASP